MAKAIDWVKDTRFVDEKGEIWILGSRVAIVNINLFKSFRDNMLKIAGPAGERMIYLSAREHTIKYVKYMIKKSRIAQLASKTGLGKKYITEQVAQILTQFGYGKMTVEKIGGEEMIASLENSVIGMQYENSEKPVCTHIAGLIAGGATAIYGKEYDCKETECIAKGDPVCRFVIRPKG
ncbi:MAG: 4-vinyl reductase [Candidatus Altiarchaeota archaeon]|nr:4-vinyl reductase [Candidatus Altiarchaeota archaeon]MBU4406642.1 4-vinyl reductase [Candidatus Altiarchaeota archaeon]